MNQQESENIVKHILEQDGYRNYHIVTNSHTTGTNVRSIVAVGDDVTITFTMNDDTGEIWSKNTSRKYYRTIVEPHIPVSDNISIISTFRSIKKHYESNPKQSSIQTAFLVGGVIVGYSISNFDPILGLFTGGILGAMSFVRPPFTKNQT